MIEMKSNKGLKTGSVRCCEFCGRDFEPYLSVWYAMSENDPWEVDSQAVEYKLSYSCLYCGCDNYTNIECLIVI